MQQTIRTALLICVTASVVNAADRNWNIGNDVQWNNIATWSEGAIPTAADDVYLNVGSTISVSGTDASANSVALNNSTGTCSLKVQDGAGLTVTGGVTDSGSGDTKVRVENTNPATAASRLAASSLQTRLLEMKGYLATDYDIAIDVQLMLVASANNLYTHTDGIISSANDGYGLTFFEATGYPATPNTAYYLLDGGTLAHERIGVGNGNGNTVNVPRWLQYGELTFNDGTIQNRIENSNVLLQNGNAYLTFDGSGDKDMQRAVHHPLTVALSESGSHTFNARGPDGIIYVTPSAQLVDKPGEAGTLLKIGDGDLLFTGGAPYGNAPDGSAYAVNSWSGCTTVEVGRVIADFNCIAGYAGSSALTNAYSPSSKLVLNGGGFVMTGRENAAATNQTVTLKNNNIWYDLTNHGLRIGQPVTHSDLPPETYVRRIINATRFEISHMANAATDNAELSFGAITNSSYQIINEVEMLQSATITVNHGGNFTLLEVDKISGATTLTKDGDGLLQLNDFTGFTGPAAVSDGTLEFALEAGIVTLTNAFTGTTAGTIAKSGAGRVVIASAGHDANTFAGTLTVKSGTLQLGDADIGNVSTQGMRNVTAANIAPGATLALRNSYCLGGIADIFLAGTLMNYDEGITAGGFFILLGAIAMEGGTLQSGRGANSDNWQSFTLRGDITVTGSAPSTIVAGGGPGDSIHLMHNAPGNRTFNVANVTGNSDPDLTTSVTFADASQSRDVAGLIKTGSGTMKLGAASVYSGGTTVAEGTLLVGNTSDSATGSGFVTVNSGATLGGTGAIITDNLTFNSGATLKVTVTNIEAGEFFKATVTSGGTLSLSDATLQIDDSTVPDNDTGITIIDNQSTASINGTFSNLPEGTKIITPANNWRITYNGGDGNDVMLMPLPEGAIIIIR